MAKTYLLGSFFISLRSNLWIIWHHCPVRIASNVTSLKDRCFRSREVTGARVCKCDSTFSTSHMWVYLGSAGLS